MGELESSNISHIYVADPRQILTTLYSGMRSERPPVKGVNRAANTLKDMFTYGLMRHRYRRATGQNDQRLKYTGNRQNL